MLGPGDVRFFDAVSRWYDLAMPAARAADLRAGLDRARRPVERVLDLGGGTGRAARALRELGVEAAVVDRSAGMLARARAAGHPAVRADAARIPVRTGGVDAVVIADALHHFPDQSAALREASRVLAPGGVLIVREFDPGTARGRALAALERLVGMDSRFLPPDTLAARVGAVGLRGSVEERGFGYAVVGIAPGDGAAASGDGRESTDTPAR